MPVLDLSAGPPPQVWWLEDAALVHNVVPIFLMVGLGMAPPPGFVSVWMALLLLLTPRQHPHQQQQLMEPPV